MVYTHCNLVWKEGILKENSDAKHHIQHLFFPVFRYVRRYGVGIPGFPRAALYSSLPLTDSTRKC